jgi:hypothetical protein
MMLPSHPKRLVNEPRPGYFFRRLCGLRLDFADESVPLSVACSQGFGESGNSLEALFVSGIASPLLRWKHLAIRPRRIRAQV